MRRTITVPLVAAGAVAATLTVAAPAQAHGYVSAPPSRQALCAQDRVPDCGQIKYEPQSVEGPKGLRSCKILAVWNISDTANAFYSCIDVQIGGGGGPTPTPTPTPTTSPTPRPTPTATPTTPPAPGGSWTTGRAYQVGDQVTYGGLTYRCRQAHTAIPGWEPPNVPALWLQV